MSRPSTGKSAPQAGGKSNGQAGAAAAGAAATPAAEPWRPKSKRAVLKNGGIVRSRGPQDLGNGVVVKEWQRTPKQMLSEYCQREKRPRPIYHRVGDDGNCCRIILPDGKRSERDIVLTTAQSFDSATDAEQYAAMLALFTLTPSIPAERKLPEPYSAAWLTMSSETPAVSAVGKFATAADRRSREEESRAKDNRRRQAVADRTKSLPPVFLSEELRHIIDGVTAHTSKHFAPSSKDDNDDSTADRNRLIRLGFTAQDVDAAIAGANSAEHELLLEWLCRHVDESRLPAAFSGKHKQLQVVMQNDDDTPMMSLLGAGYMGVPTRRCRNAFAESGEDAIAAVQRIYTELYTHIGAVTDDARDDNADSGAETLESEIIAVESIYGEDVVTASDRIVVSLKAPTPMSVTILLTSRYPQCIPPIIITSPDWTPQRCLRAVAAAARYLASLKLIGEPMIYEIINFLQQQHSDEPLTLPSEWYQTQLPQTTTAPSTTVVDDSAAQARPRARNPRSTGRQQGATVPSTNNADTERVRRDYDSSVASAAYQQMLKTRKSLPVYSRRETIRETLQANRVVVLTGATGSGKSTQLPQFVYEFALESGQTALQIICTQPRRISAVSLATRVAAERGQTVGETVGYRIKGESRVSSQTCLTYVTTGVLISQLTNDQRLSNITHIVIDEVHERSVDIDLLLLIIREVLTKRLDLKLILMSATVDAERFSAYFNNAPVIIVEGRTFPVEHYYLEDVLQETKFVPDHRYRISLKQDELKKQINFFKNDQIMRQYDENVLATIATLNEEKLNIAFCAAAVMFAIQRHERGAILVFVAGIREVNDLLNAIHDSLDEQQSDSFLLIPLHSQLSSADQQKVFRRVTPPARKIIVATNIAETSVTVDDVVCVVDTGRMRQNDVSASGLTETWVSQANASQRSGRAGRVSAGTCYRLFSRRTFASLPAQPVPEINRIALDHVALKIKTLQIVGADGAGGCLRALNRCISPPSATAIQTAVATLYAINAIDSDETPTPLGRHLAALPVNDTRTGKLLLYGAILGCTRAACRIAALNADKSLFVAPYESRDDAAAKHNAFAVVKSDHIAQLRAYEGWIAAKKNGGGRAARAFAEENFLSDTVANGIADEAEHFNRALKQIGFSSADADENADNTSIISAVITASLYPNIIRVRMPDAEYAESAHGAVKVQNDARDIKFYMKMQSREEENKERTDDDDDADDTDGGPQSLVWRRVFIHPRSVNFVVRHFEYPYLTYRSTSRSGDKVYVVDSTMSAPYALLLLCGHDITTNIERGTISLDGEMNFAAVGRIAALLRSLRTLFDGELTRKIADPSAQLNARTSPVVAVIIRLLTGNGN